MIVQTVDQFVKKHDLIQEGSTIVIGVSGGPDSMGLLHYLTKKRERWGLTLIVAHVDHQLRKEDSERDYRYVQTYCNHNGLLFEGAKVDVRSYQNENHLSLQVAARECRYQFFSAVMHKYNANYLALGHHGDDQVETMLMRQVRGAFGYSLAGIPVKRKFATGNLIRPFLCLSKTDIEVYLNEVGIKPRIDRSNDSNQYTRNRFRHAVLPFLKQENPKVHARFQYQSEVLSLDEQYLSSLANEWFQKVVITSKKDEKVIVKRQQFLAVPIALQRRIIHLVLNYLCNDGLFQITSVHIEHVFNLMRGDNSSGYVHLPNGLRVIRSYDEMVFLFSSECDSHSFRYLLSIPSEVQLPTGKISGKIRSNIPKQLSRSRQHFFADADALFFPLIVRSRLPGDRLEPLGMEGSKKLKDIFIDAKIARAKRSHIPVVTDAKGRILWVVTVRKSRIGSITKGTTKILHLAYEEF